MISPLMVVCLQNCYYSFVPVLPVFVYGTCNLAALRQPGNWVLGRVCALRSCGPSGPLTKAFISMYVEGIKSRTAILALEPTAFCCLGA